MEPGDDVTSPVNCGISADANFLKEGDALLPLTGPAKIYVAGSGAYVMELSDIDIFAVVTLVNCP